MTDPSNAFYVDYTIALRLQLEEAAALIDDSDLLSLADGLSETSPQIEADLALSTALYHSDVDAILDLTAPPCVQEPTAQQPVASQLLPCTVFQCVLCLDYVQHMFGLSLGACHHRFCGICLRRLLEFVVKERRVLPIECPLCFESLDPELCLQALNGTEAYNTFSLLVVEHIHHRKLRYCASPKCGVPFDAAGVENVKVSCPLCETEMCVDCRLPWHEGKTCAENRAIGQDMEAVSELARVNLWMPCPNCLALIEKAKDSCNFVKCRCGTGFCFNCGKAYQHIRGTANNTHGEANCNCGLFGSTGNQQAVLERVPQAIEAANLRNSDHEPNRRAFDLRRRGRVPPFIESCLRRNSCPYGNCRHVFPNRRDLEQHLTRGARHSRWLCCNRPFLSERALEQHRIDKHSD